MRIFDYGHAAEYVVKAAQAVFGVGSVEYAEWLGNQLHQLRHGESEKLLDALRRLEQQNPLEYLDKRKEQIRYREFEALGYPIGSGMIESGNKLVMQSRLKRSGMHWARASVNPMCALRTVVCSERWAQEWPLITTAASAQTLSTNTSPKVKARSCAVGSGRRSTSSRSPSRVVPEQA